MASIGGARRNRARLPASGGRKNRAIGVNRRRPKIERQMLTGGVKNSSVCDNKSAPNGRPFSLSAKRTSGAPNSLSKLKLRPKPGRSAENERQRFAGSKGTRASRRRLWANGLKSKTRGGANGKEPPTRFGGAKRTRRDIRRVAFESVDGFPSAIKPANRPTFLRRGVPTFKKRLTFFNGGPQMSDLR